MLKLLVNNKIATILDIREVLLHNSYKIYSHFISITVTGRIFRWVKGYHFMQFVLPVSNKPALFLKHSYCAQQVTNSDFYNFIWFSSECFLTFKNIFFKIKKPSIFNKRGFHILNKIIYRKRGKVTAYVTNK